MDMEYAPDFTAHVARYYRHVWLARKGGRKAEKLYVAHATRCLTESEYHQGSLFVEAI